MNFAPWPCFEDDEIQAAVSVLKSGKVNQWTGSKVSSFENEFAEYLGTKYAVALANGSLALDLALRAYNIGKGDEVIVTPRSFLASVSCVVLSGATPVFVDVDPTTQNITLESISKAVTAKTKAVIAVHLAGWPCELDKIQSFCRQNNIVLIEDCAQAHGASFKNKKVGSFGDCSIFSFCQDKIMTTGGEGGMLVTNNRDIWESVWSYKDHGKDYERAFDRNHASGFRWLASSFGTNCRMTEMQAAMGRIQLKKLDPWVKKRRRYAETLNQAFINVPGLRTTLPNEDVYHSYYKYYVFVDPEELKPDWTRTDIIEALNQKGVSCNTGICPEIYLERAFAQCSYRISDSKKEQNIPRLPIAKQLGETSMMFMVHPNLEINSIEFVVEQVGAIMEKAVR